MQDAETHYLRLGPPTFDLRKIYSRYCPDIIQLCDVSANTVRFADIVKLPCPVVHRMSDFWPYHGARHYAERPPDHPDLADRLLRRWIHADTGAVPCRVAPSHWLAERLGGHGVTVIRNAVTVPHGIAPKPGIGRRLRFGFIAARVLDPRKGFTALAPVLDAFAARTGRVVELQVFGNAPRKGLPVPAAVTTCTHPAFGRNRLSEVFGRFDILLCPSRQDNSPNVVTEALAHGVPVIGQSGTGMDSYVTTSSGALVDFHGDVGRAADAFTDAANRIAADLTAHSAAALAFARQELGPETIGRQYRALYERLVERTQA